MKRISLLLCLILILFCGCSTPKIEKSGIKIVASVFSCYDFARAVTGEDANIEMLIDAGGEIHSFEPTAKDIINIGESDMFIYVGGESDKWVERVLSSVDTKKVHIFKMTDYVPLLNEDNSEEYDEHNWTSPENAKALINAIANVLSEIDAKNTEKYTENAKTYIQKIDIAAEQIKQTVENAKNKQFVVADRFPLKYFAEYYGLSYRAAFAGCEHDTDADLKTVTELIDTVKNNQLSAVFHIELSNKRLANTVAEQTGVAVYELHSAHNITADDFNNGVTYVDIMERNNKVLQKGLN